MFGEYDGDAISESEWDAAEMQAITELLDGSKEGKDVIKLIVSLPGDSTKIEQG